MKFGCCTAAQNYQTLARCGYDYIELSGHEVLSMEEAGWQAFLKAMEETGVPCVGFNDYCHGVPVIAGDGFDPEAARDYARRLALRGAQAGVKSIGIGAPAARRLPEGYPADKADEQCRRFLSITAKEAAEHGVNILFEAVHSGMCNYATRTADAARMVRGMQTDNLFMVLDFYHMEVMGEDKLDFDDCFPLIRHLHYNHRGDNNAREYPGPADLEDLTAIMKKLRSLGYDGTFSIEAQTEDFPADAARALAVLRQAAQAAGY